MEAKYAPLNASTGSKPIPAAYAGAAGEELILERTVRQPVSGAAESQLEIIRFAVGNRLSVEPQCQGSIRLIEPCLLRRTRNDAIILHTHNIDRGEHRSYRVDRIEGARDTNQTFIPRYAIELAPKGIIAIAPITTGEPARTSGSAGMGWAAPRTRMSRSPRARSTSGFGYGLTYVYECSYCGKRFNGKTQTAALNPHRSVYPCDGWFAHLVDIR